MPDSPAAPRQPSSGPPADGADASVSKEMGPQPSTPPCSSTTSHRLSVEDDFQFILCEGCRQESPNLKLLSCLHTLCLGCLSENKPIGQCPVCRMPIPQAHGVPDMDNLLFTNLQARLKVYKKIRDSDGPSCSRCHREAAAVWCSECEEFLCTKCFEDHQWFFKKMSHEARKVEELRAESAHHFLEDTRKPCNLFCSQPGHTDQLCSIYCKKCEKALCCICAVLDSQHGPFCDIRGETQRRQEELATINQELRQKRSILEATFMSLQDEATRLKEAQREMQELIRQRVEQLVELLRREEEELLGLVEARQEQGHRELAGELQRVGGLLQRLEAGERLVETMNLYATEQEVMDMQPFIKSSLEELQRLEPLAVAGDRAQPRDMAECRARLQALVERVTGKPGPHFRAVPTVEVALENNLQEEPAQPECENILPTFTISLKDMCTNPASDVTTCPRRRPHCLERGTQILPKMLKLECNNTLIPSNSSSTKCEDGRGPSTSKLSRNCNIIPAARSHVDDAEDTSIIISSSEDSSEDTADYSKPKGDKKPSSPMWSESGTSPRHSTGPASPWDDVSEHSTLVFLSLKVDQKTQHIMEMAAANGEHTFKTVIQTPESVLALLSQGVPLEMGMQHLLWYISPLPKPILVVYNFWALELPALFKALDTTGQKMDFCRIVCGYVDMLSLIKEKLPEDPSYKLKNLLRRHRQQQLNESSALAMAKALQELWGALQLPAHADTGMMLTHCNLQSYTVLRPLVKEKLLTRRAAKILARRNLILWELEEA